MSTIILLDTGPLGLVTHPRASSENDGCNQWLRSQITQRKLVVIPGISDYELRRGLIRIGSAKGIARLEALKNSLLFAPITTARDESGCALLGSCQKDGETNRDRPGIGR